MSNHQFENCEISDADLAHVQGGNIFGDIWRGVKKAGEKIVNVIVNAFDELKKWPPTLPSPTFPSPTFPRHY